MQCAVTGLLFILLKETYLSESMRHKTVINYCFFLLCINHCNFKVCNRNALDIWEERSFSAFCRDCEHTPPALGHFVTPLRAGRPVLCSTRERGSQLSKEAKFSVFCCKSCLSVKVCWTTACLDFPEGAWFAAFRLCPGAV